MSVKQKFRPWGELAWTLGLSTPRRWRFFGCVGPEERSVKALIEFCRLGFLENYEMLRIIDTTPEDLAKEDVEIRKRLLECNTAGCPVQLNEIALDAPLMNSVWRSKFSFPSETSFCLDISSLPKRFFFRVIKAVLASPQVKDFVIVYSKPSSYASRALSSDPDPWRAITGFMCDDPEQETKAASRLIVGAGFAVDGLREYLEGRNDGIQVEVLIPFPAGPWRSVHRSWESAKEIEESLAADPDNENVGVKPSYHRVGALDTSTAFDTLLRLTRVGESPAAFAPLGPKPMSVAMCLLASQAGHFPVYYAQPKTYAVDYSSGCDKIYAYWIKHNGVNLYSIPEVEEIP